MCPSSFINKLRKKSNLRSHLRGRDIVMCTWCKWTPWTEMKRNEGKEPEGGSKKPKNGEWQLFWASMFGKQQVVVKKMPVGGGCLGFGKGGARRIPILLYPKFLLHFINQLHVLLARHISVERCICGAGAAQGLGTWRLLCALKATQVFRPANCARWPNLRAQSLGVFAFLTDYSLVIRWEKPCAIYRNKN